MRNLLAPVRKHRSLAAVFLALGVILLLFGGFCPVRDVWGVPCPGCGMTRAFEALLHGDVRGAFFYHPGFPVVIVFGLYTLWRLGRHGEKAFSSKGFLGAVWAASLALVVLYVVRMALVFPRYPMDFNSDALLPALIRRLARR